MDILRRLTEAGLAFELAKVAQRSALLIGHRGVRAICERFSGLHRALVTWPGTALRIGLTFMSVSLAWIFFRATTFGAAASMFEQMFVPARGMSLPLHKSSLLWLAAVVVACHLIAQRGLWNKLAARLPAPIMGIGYAVVLTLALVLSPDAGKAFIYFLF